ncbi:MAG TPA: fused response regulator/phosphatase [Vicinamibacteria bacterium]|nr:fused response regulator/phosphatase [Vicinamibacteria bacterium]
MKELSDCRILIVDDAQANVDVLVNALRDEYKLSVAIDGEGALRSIEKSFPDLVLLDIVMPGIDGYEVCRRLRAAPGTRALPIMFLSSLEDVKDKTRGFEAGANDYVTKPFEVLEVKARVRSLLEAKSYADAVREAAERDLRIAREIQMGILPADVPARVRGTGLDVHALLEPAQQVGGDLYEVLRLDDGRVMVAVGDVSGKGIPAALFMAVTMTLLRSMARQHAAPDEILRRVNDELLDQNPRQMFVTLQCLVFEPGGRRVSCASAGHHSAVLLSPGKPPRLVIQASGRVVGVLPANPIEAESLELQPGETLVLFTDGVSEAFDPRQELFGEERLLAHLAKEPGGDAKETTLGVVAAVRRHAAGAKQSDDITVVSVRSAPGK